MLLEKKNEKRGADAVRPARAVPTVGLRIPVQEAVLDPTRRIPVDQVGVDPIPVIVDHPIHHTAVGQVTVGGDVVADVTMTLNEAGNDRMNLLLDRIESRKGRWTACLDGVGPAVVVHRMIGVVQSTVCLGVDDRSVEVLPIGARVDAIGDGVDHPAVARLHPDAEIKIAIVDPLVAVQAKKELDGGETRATTVVGDLAVHLTTNDEDGETPRCQNE